MKQKIVIAFLAIFLLCGLPAQVFAESGNEMEMTSTLRSLGYGNTDLNGYGSVEYSSSRYYNQAYKYMLLTRTVTVTNTSNSTMNAQLYLPYLYSYGLSPDDNTSYDYIGYPANWNSTTNKFMFDKYVTNGGYINTFVSDQVDLNYPARKDLKDAQYFINDLLYKQGDLANWEQDIPVVRELAVEDENDTIIEFDIGELAPGASKSFTFEIKYYGIPTYSGVNGVDFVTYLRTEVNAKPVTVQYLDVNGDAIASADIINEDGSQLVNESYTTIPKEISGYNLVQLPMNAHGVLSDQEQSVIYTYEKINNGEVTAHYQDESGNSLIDSITMSGAIGSNYQTEAQTIAGWELTNTIGANSGAYSAALQTVTYVYSPLTTVDSLPNTGNNHDAYIALGLGTIALAGTTLTILKLRRR